MPKTHPRDALFGGRRPFPLLSACEHYAGSEKLMRKALRLQAEKNGAFDVTLDLEDAAPEGREAEHAQLVVDLLRSDENRHRRAGVRVHDVLHPAFARDVETVIRGAGEQLAYLTLPKPAGLGDVERALAAFAAASRSAGLARTIPVHVLIEGHGALRDAFAIAARPEVEVLDFGLMDFVSDHHGAIPASAMRSPGQFEHALVRRAKVEIAAAALAHGAVPSHNVTLELKDPEVTRADASRAYRELGYLRMWSVHPAQIDPILEAMRPDFSEVALAGEILLLAQARDWAPVEHRGRLHDRASYRYDWQLLERGRRAGALLPEDVETTFFSCDGASDA